MSIETKTLGERVVQAARMAVGQHLAATLLEEMNRRRWRAGGAGSEGGGDAGAFQGRTRMSSPASFTDEPPHNAGNPSDHPGRFPFADGGPQ